MAEIAYQPEGSDCGDRRFGNVNQRAATARNTIIAYYCNILPSNDSGAPTRNAVRSAFPKKLTKSCTLLSAGFVLLLLAAL